MKTCAVIAAAGSGKRFKSRTPKQFVKVNGRELLAYALDNFEAAGSVDGILLVVSRKHINHARKLVKKYGYKKISGIIEGGAERYDSVFNALQYLKDNKPENVLIHDGARPLPAKRVIEQITSALKKDAAVVPVNRVYGTVKRVKGGYALGTIDRDTLRTTHTPQGFRFSELARLYTREQIRKLKPTDEAMVFEAAGKRVRVIEDETPNIKLTTKKDLEILKVLLSK